MKIVAVTQLWAWLSTYSSAWVDSAFYPLWDGKMSIIIIA